MRGHCGTKQFFEITFVFEATSLLDATRQARQMPAVKHHSKRCILAGKEITYEEYKERITKGAYGWKY